MLVDTPLCSAQQAPACCWQPPVQFLAHLPLYQRRPLRCEANACCPPLLSCCCEPAAPLRACASCTVGIQCLCMHANEHVCQQQPCVAAFCQRLALLCFSPLHPAGWLCTAVVSCPRRERLGHDCGLAGVYIYLAWLFRMVSVPSYASPPAQASMQKQPDFARAAGRHCCAEDVHTAAASARGASCTCKL